MRREIVRIGNSSAFFVPDHTETFRLALSMPTQFHEKALTHLVRDLFTDLPPRYREVLSRRYGMKTGDAETLEAIGDDFGVTRERIRQIENAAFTALNRARAQERAREVIEPLQSHLEDHGSLRREDRLLEELVVPHEQPQLLFMLDLGEPFVRHHERDWHWSVWSTDAEALRRAEAFLRTLREALEQRENPLARDEFFSFAQGVAKDERFSLPERAVESYVDLFKDIDEGPFGDWGLRTWPEVAPRGVRDRAFLILKREGKPLHFRDVTAVLGKLRKEGIVSWPMPNEQTVHNELLKDDRFVLVGRGLYALREWGYEPGTVRDVIAAILRSAGRPLSKEEIFEKVQEKRMVKPATIFLNLHNKQSFARTPEGRYMVK